MNLALYDSGEYRIYTPKGELDKALHTLEGILKGIGIDNVINQKEIDELLNWCSLYKRFSKGHPFNELIPLVEKALNDNIITDDEKQDILWLCESFKSTNVYYDVVTSDIQRLQGILHGILADNIITVDEVKGLQEWVYDNDHLLGVYPYDEVQSLVTSVLSDGKIDENEKQLLKLFFSEFIDLRESFNINETEINKIKNSMQISGICSMCPEIGILDSLFCFTGVSSKYTRIQIKDIIESLGGRFYDSVRHDTKYLVIGNGGNPCWAFSCYGRKVEKAVQLRKAGKPILIIHENDFWDAVADM